MQAGFVLEYSSREGQRVCLQSIVMRFVASQFVCFTRAASLVVMTRGVSDLSVRFAISIEYRTDVLSQLCVVRVLVRTLTWFQHFFTMLLNILTTLQIWCGNRIEVGHLGGLLMDS